MGRGTDPQPPLGMTSPPPSEAIACGFRPPTFPSPLRSSKPKVTRLQFPYLWRRKKEATRRQYPTSPRVHGRETASLPKTYNSTLLRREDCVGETNRPCPRNRLSRHPGWYRKLYPPGESLEKSAQIPDCRPRVCVSGTIATFAKFQSSMSSTIFLLNLGRHS